MSEAEPGGDERRLRDRLADLPNLLPRGTGTVGAWLLFTGLVTYGFATVSARALGADRYAPLSTLWALSFLVAPGVFLPLEQEVTRAISERRVHGVGSGPVVRLAAIVGGAAALVLASVALLAREPLADALFDGQQVLVVAFALVLVGYWCDHLTRGVLSSHGRFGSYGMIFGTEGLVRFVAAVVLALIGVEVAGPYGMAVGLAPFFGTAAAVVRERAHRLVTPGPPARWAELSANLALLLAGSLLAQTLVNAGPLVVQGLVDPGDEATTSSFLVGLLVARVPLYFFQAVQASLLPNLSQLQTAGKRSEASRALARLVVVVILLGTAMTMGCAALGPWVVRLVFGEDFVLSGLDMALLAAGSALVMLALGLAQALVALHRHREVALAWLVGVTVFAVAVLVGSGVLLRVEIAYVLGAAVAAGGMTLFVWIAARTGGSAPGREVVEHARP